MGRESDQRKDWGRGAIEMSRGTWEGWVEGQAPTASVAAIICDVVPARLCMCRRSMRARRLARGSCLCQVALAYLVSRFDWSYDAASMGGEGPEGAWERQRVTLTLEVGMLTEVMWQPI
jgi:hypothetical protein